MNKPLGILCFPGTQCERDSKQALDFLSIPSRYIGHKERFFPKNYAGFILPGGFAHGDYLRSGALAAKSPAIKDLKSADKKGFPILGICNGFQILCEAGFLLGSLQMNINRRFIDEWIKIKKVGSNPYWETEVRNIESVSLPIDHAEGRFYASLEQIKILESENLIWWKYIKNLNGSLENIAGIMNKNKNTAGLMPHPERAAADWMGGSSGLNFFKYFC